MNRVDWLNPLDCRTAQNTWHDLLDVYGQTVRLVSKHAWLAGWRGIERGREVVLQVYGDVPTQKKQGNIDAGITPAWAQAGLQRKPTHEVLLRRAGGDPAAVLYFSEADDRAFVSISWPASDGAHWLDVVGVHCHPLEAPDWDYIIVEPDGKWTRPDYAQQGGSGE